MDLKKDLKPQMDHVSVESVQFKDKLMNNSQSFSKMNPANCNGFVPQDISLNKPLTNRVTFQCLYKVVYLGYAVLDRRYTLPMLPWVIAEIKRYGSQNAEDIYLEVTDSCLNARNISSNKLVFEHKLITISKFAQTAQDPKCFTYMTREVVNGPCAYHVFQANDEPTVLELFTTLREMSKELALNQQLITPLVNSTISPDDIMCTGQHYEVMYLGRIKVSSKRAPPSFIDDAVDKFKVYELEKVRNRQVTRSDSLGSMDIRQRHGSGASITSLPYSFDPITQLKDNLLASQTAHVSPPSSLLNLGPNNKENTPSISHNSSWDELHRVRQDSISSDVFNSPSVPSLKSPTVPSQEDEKIKSSNTLMLPSSLIPHTQSLDTASSPVNVENLENMHLSSVLRGRVRSCSGDIPRASKQTSLPVYRTRVGSGGASDIRRPRAYTSPPNSSSATQQKNRTMLFLIGRLEICLIGMDKKQVLLNKTFNDIAHCSQGVKYLDHFGFICRETTAAGADCYAGYIFRCQTEQVVDEIMQSLKLAFQKAHQDYQHNGHVKSPNVPRVIVCETCPMQWFHRLCSDIDGLPPDNCHCSIILKLHTLPEFDRDEILQNCESADVNHLQDQNEILMILLRKYCEQKQLKHNHCSNANGAGMKNDYMFLKEKNAGSKLDTFRQKAKTLSSSLETFLKLKNREDSRERSLTPVFDNTFSAMRQSKSDVIEEVLHREGSYDGPESPSSGQREPIRPRSSTFSTTNEVRKASQKRTAGRKKDNNQNKSPIMNIFMKVGHSDKTPTSSGDEAEVVSKKGSWRQAIFHRVQTPVQTPKRSHGPIETKINESSSDEEGRQRKTSEQLRALWKKAILEQILLIRMERENKKLQVKQDAVSHKRMKLDYEDITPCLKDITQKWENLLENNSESPIDKEYLFDLVKAGVPRTKRGEIWQFLAQHYDWMLSAQSVFSESDISTPYEDLIGQLTSHQHAILIDLGRTFPSHPFYCQPLGPGQLSLFNILKAYSLLDKKVGYCQGLSFVAGILLLHMPEEQAFDMMKHLLFRLGLRRQYKPDMVALQIQMYQLSRLMHDNHRDIYDHFERYDIAPTLYAAPWFLTLFASQFPLGFVSRLFDILFLQGVDTIFKVAMVLIGNSKDRLLQCHGFEAIMECLKTYLPAMNAIEMERVFQQIFTMDIHKQLHAYEVEYHVLQEEMLFSPSRSDTEIAQKLETANKNLKVQNMELAEQLQVAYSTIDHLKSSETSYKSTVQKLESRVNALEDENDALRHSLNAMKKRLQKLEKSCMSSDDGSQINAIMEDNHTPSFQVVYDLAGTEKEEDDQFKSFMDNFNKEQFQTIEDTEDVIDDDDDVQHPVESENSDNFRESPPLLLNSNVSSLNYCTPKHYMHLSVEKERMKHNL